MSARIEIRIPQELKSKLEAIAQMHGVSLSDLIRNAINVVLIQEYIDQYKTIEEMERALVRMIVEKPEFQEMLRKLMEYTYSVEECYQWECEERTVLDKVITRIDTYRYASIIKGENGKLYPAIWYEDGYDNITGSKHYYLWSRDAVSTLDELADWLEAVKNELEEKIRDKLQTIKESAKRLIEF